MTEEKAKSLIGRKVRGFKFESNDIVLFTPNMKNYIGVIGKILDFEGSDFLVSFEDNSYYYPASLIEAHLVEEGISDDELNKVDNVLTEIEQLKADNAELVDALKMHIEERKDAYKFMTNSEKELHEKTKQLIEKHGKL